MPTQLLTPSGPLFAVLMAVLVLSAWFDVTEKRIPNWVTMGGLVAALVLRGFIGLDALGVGILGAALGFALGILLFAVGAMGAGDGKLLVTVGAFFGFEAFFFCLPLIGIFGGLLVLVVTAGNGTLFPTLIRFRELLLYLVSFGRIGDRRTLSTPGAVTIPYGVAVAVGALTAWLGWGPSL